MTVEVEYEKCDKSVYENGETVAVIANLTKSELQDLVEMLGDLTGQEVDWHYAAGRAVIKATGDVEKVRAGIRFAFSAANLFGGNVNAMVM